ncbi:hypothetical protein SPRG_16106 [Saprolegnia parasitica CBS 223.65]|uniref:CBM1 domain-containing protein n=1 Tax=Saprolegnia parasitica (strain CBS 223.65) TaxID=695850 RepID=A0A067BJE1_SAPPC|nr:hypothetical protein SPRG_16106 [Saprolegnia parasitica CBS 223.65]KDO18554.1 hypothetical protein SPRG_16106 [Saprolegnia parasitica CBS 223.65]|eukprot:XP_012210742.1 hypothetical protein SPRG_16106 [Saprolegnia parasitica CBS 223.65]
MKAALILTLTSAVVADTLEAEAKVVDVWGQCGGKYHNGDTACASGSFCKFYNEWFSQCQPGGNGQVGLWGRCGGKDYDGDTQCTPGNECKVWNDYYSQCVPGTATPTTAPPEDVAVPLNWLQSDAVCYNPMDGDSDTVANGITSFDACIIEANKRGKKFANWDDQTRECTVLQDADSYRLSRSCKSAAKYNLDKWKCWGNHDYWNNDVGKSTTRLDQCLDACENFSEGGKKCNAVYWVQHWDSDKGVCNYKYIPDTSKAPFVDDIGGTACARRS